MPVGESKSAAGGVGTGKMRLSQSGSSERAYRFIRGKVGKGVAVVFQKPVAVGAAGQGVHREIVNYRCSADLRPRHACLQAADAVSVRAGWLAPFDRERSQDGEVAVEGGAVADEEVIVRAAVEFVLA